MMDDDEIRYQLERLKGRVDDVNEKVDQILYRLAEIDKSTLVHLVRELQLLRGAVSKV